MTNENPALAAMEQRKMDTATYNDRAGIRDIVESTAHTTQRVHLAPRNVSGVVPPLPPQAEDTMQATADRMAHAEARRFLLRQMEQHVRPAAYRAASVILEETMDRDVSVRLNFIGDIDFSGPGVSITVWSDGGVRRGVVEEPATPLRPPAQAPPSIPLTAQEKRAAYQRQYAARKRAEKSGAK